MREDESIDVEGLVALLRVNPGRRFFVALAIVCGVIVAGAVLNTIALAAMTKEVVAMRQELLRERENAIADRATQVEKLKALAYDLTLAEGRLRQEILLEGGRTRDALSQ